MKKLEESDYQLDLLFENRLIQPVMNIQDKKLLSAVEMLHLNPKSKRDILRMLTGVRNSLI